MQCELAVVGQHFVHVAQFDRHFGCVRRKQKCRRVGKDMHGDQGFSGQKLGKLALAIGGQRVLKILPLQINQTGAFPIYLGHGQRDGKRPAQRRGDRGLAGRCQRIVTIAIGNPVDQLHALGFFDAPGHQTRCCRSEPPPCSDPGGPLRRGVGYGRLADPGRVIKSVHQRKSGVVMLANVFFAQFHLIGCQAHFTHPLSSSFSKYFRRRQTGACSGNSNWGFVQHDLGECDKGIVILPPAEVFLER